MDLPLLVFSLLVMKVRIRCRFKMLQMYLVHFLKFVGYKYFHNQWQLRKSVFIVCTININVVQDHSSWLVQDYENFVTRKYHNMKVYGLALVCY
jgi:hypothetical protein